MLCYIIKEKDFQTSLFIELTVLKCLLLSNYNINILLI